MHATHEVNVIREAAVSDPSQLPPAAIACMLDRLDSLLARSVVLTAEHRAWVDEAVQLLGAIAEASAEFEIVPGH